MERKIVLIIIFSILIISNVLCITTIIRINSGLMQLEEEKEEDTESILEFEERLDKLEGYARAGRGAEEAREMKKRLSKIEQHMGIGKERGEEYMQEIRERLDALEQHDRASGGVVSVQEIKARFGRLKQHVDFQEMQKKQIEKRLDKFERHGGDQARRCTEDVREVEKRVRKLEQKMSVMENYLGDIG